MQGGTALQGAGSICLRLAEVDRDLQSLLELMARMVRSNIHERDVQLTLRQGVEKAGKVLCEIQHECAFAFSWRLDPRCNALGEVRGLNR